jgi:hypothetical protein
MTTRYAAIFVAFARRGETSAADANGLIVDHLDDEV